MIKYHTMITHENINPDKKASWCYFHFPTGGGDRWGLRGVGRGLASVAGCHSGSRDHLPPSCWCPVIPELFITARWESDMRCPPNPPAPSIPHFPLWIFAADSCQDCADVPKHPPTMYLHVFAKLVWICFKSHISLFMSVCLIFSLQAESVKSLHTVVNLKEQTVFLQFKIVYILHSCQPICNACYAVLDFYYISTQLLVSIIYWIVRKSIFRHFKLELELCNPSISQFILYVVLK